MPHRPIIDTCKISQEIIDMIIDQLAGDLPSLRACALVCHRWRSRSHHQLFRSVEITNEKEASSVRQWCTLFPAIKGDTPARFTKELHLTQMRKIWLYPEMLRLYLPHLSAFSNVQILVITNLATTVFHPRSLPLRFGLAFPRVLKLRLSGPVACPTSLLRFILTFQNISSLEIQHPRWIRGVGDENSSLAPRNCNNIAFNGDLCLAGLGAKFDEFTSLLVGQGMKFKTVQLLRCGFSSDSAMKNFLDAIRGTLTVLSVAPLEKGRKWIPVAMSACDNLKTLAFDMRGGVQMEEVVGWVSSITSTRLAVFALDFGDRGARSTGSGDSLGKIKPLDQPLSELARRVYGETGKRLTLVLVANNPCGLVAGLPEFRRVGNVWRGERVINDANTKNHFWSFLAATESECQEVDESVLDYLRV